MDFASHHRTLAGVATRHSTRASQGEPRSPGRWRRACAASGLALSVLAGAPPVLAQQLPDPVRLQAERIDLGQPSVLSQRGQRLKVAVPYGSAPGAQVSPMRIWVAAVEVPPGEAELDARTFTVLRPERRNLVIVQSREPVTASRLTLTLKVAGQDDASTFDLAVPPIRFAAPERPETPAAQRPPARRRAGLPAGASSAPDPRD